MLTRKTSSADALAASINPIDDGHRLARLAAEKARCVLIGEASHGTHEFYALRGDLTRRLIEAHGFRMVVLEADWPDALRVNRYVTGAHDDASAVAALGDFRRFPAWMWRNTVMTEFIDWLKEWNARHPSAKVQIFGMDLYSMHTSINAVLDYLDKTDATAAKRARRRYGCFEIFGDDPRRYGYEASVSEDRSCEDEVIKQLTELRLQYASLLKQDGQGAEDEFFYAEQNARLVANAERYYRSMFQGREASWNLRDRHMAETLEALTKHFLAPADKQVVWAHNSHLGDARATSMRDRGEWNVGQLVRQSHPPDSVFSIGLVTYSGTVTAARDWGDPAERRQVRPALKESYENLFHETQLGDFWIDLRADTAATRLLRKPLLQRAIGVIYRPETERWSHYAKACLPGQFDACIHLDETHALKPLERDSQWTEGELPETYPSTL